MRKIIWLFILLGFQLHAQKSTVAFTLSEKDLLPESVAYDANTNSFFVGSTRKGTITRIDKDGNQSVFVETREFGHWMVIGMKVDSERNELWFCSSGGNNLVGYNLNEETDGRPAGIFKVDLNSGKLIKKYTLEKRGENHFFNDLVIDKNGDVYASHMFAEHAIYKIARDKDQLELFAKSDEIRYPNGLDISGDGESLYVAHAGGIARVALGTGQVRPLAIANDLQLTGRSSADGLYFYKGNLVAIHPDIAQVGIYQIGHRQDAIIKGEILEKNHPRMDHPTTGVLVGDDFYYVANAQFEKVGQDGSLIVSEVAAPVILKVSLK